MILVLSQAVNPFLNSTNEWQERGAADQSQALKTEICSLFLSPTVSKKVYVDYGWKISTALSNKIHKELQLE